MCLSGIEQECEKKASKIGPVRYIEIRKEDNIYLFAIQNFYVMYDGYKYYSVRAKYLARSNKNGRAESQAKNFDLKDEFKYEIFNNSISFTVDESNQKIMLGPRGQVSMFPKGVGLGRYVLSEAISLILPKYPEYAFEKGRLAENDADKDNIHRRTKFYENAGFTVNVSKNGGGSFSCEKVSQLKVASKRDSWKEYSEVEFFQKFLEQKNEMLEQAKRISSLEVELQEKEVKYKKLKSYLKKITVTALVCIAYILLANY